MSQAQELKKKSATTKNLKEFVSAKKLTAMIVWRKSQQDIEHVSNFARKLESAISYKLSVTEQENISREFLHGTSVSPTIGLVCGGDDVLCGGINKNILAYYNADATPKTYVIGKKISEENQQWENICKLDCNLEDLDNFASNILKQIRCGEISNLRVFYTDTDKQCKHKDCFPLAKVKHKRAILKEDVDVSYLSKMLLSVKLYEMILKTKNRENLERIITSDQSQKNCDKQLEELKIIQNKIRQAQITNELCETVSGNLA